MYISVPNLVFVLCQGQWKGGTGEKSLLSETEGGGMMPSFEFQFLLRPCWLCDLGHSTS